jgi:hypothetical protein
LLLGVGLLSQANPAQARETGKTSLATQELKGVSAQIGKTDGVYGRFLGDTELAIGVGPELDRTGLRLRGQLEAHYFWSLGVYAAVSQGLATDADRGPLGSLGVSFKPAFLPRFGLDLEQGPALLDLLLDSICLQLGAYTSFKSEPELPSAGLEAALSAGVPFQSQANGFWLFLRGGLRLSNTETGRAPGYLGVLLSYRWPWLSPALR